jgi:hypothetical protein
VVSREVLSRFISVSDSGGTSRRMLGATRIYDL